MHLKLPDDEMARIYHQLFIDKIPVTKVAIEHGVSDRAVRRWRQCWEKYGVPWIVTGKKKGRPPKPRPDGEPYVPRPPKSKEPKYTKGGKPLGRPRKKHLILGNCSMNKKQMGDKIQDALRIDPEGLPRMHFEMDMDTDFFRTFFVENLCISPPRPAPAEFNEFSPVVVTEYDNAQAGELLGKDKVHGRHKFAPLILAKLCIIFRPSEGKATAYISPEGKSSLLKLIPGVSYPALGQLPTWAFDGPVPVPNPPAHQQQTMPQDQSMPQQQMPQQPNMHPDYPDQQQDYSGQTPQMQPAPHHVPDQHQQMQPVQTEQYEFPQHQPESPNTAAIRALMTSEQPMLGNG